jgi:hypothetical protein
MTGQAFRACVEQFPAPARESGGVVLLDSLAAPEVHDVRQAIAAAGAPIEQLLAKLKALPRKVAARTKDALWSTIGGLPGRRMPQRPPRLRLWFHLKWR